MTFRVDRRLMHHSGGTKFYQLFHLTLTQAGMSLATTLTHWGAMKIISGQPRAGKEPRPVLGGQMQHLEDGHFASKTNEKLKGDAKGRYFIVHDSHVTFSDDAAFKTWVIQQVGAEHSHNIFLALGLAENGEAGMIDPIDGSFVPSKPTPRVLTEDEELNEILQSARKGAW